MSSEFPRTYRIALASRVLWITVSALLIVGCIVGAAVVLLAEGSEHTFVSAIIGLCLLFMTIMSIYLIVSTIRSKVVLHEGLIEVHGVMRSRQLDRAEIVGGRIKSVNGNHVIHLLSR